MKKRILALLLAAATALGLCACAPEGDRSDSGKLSVVCSLFPYYDFVRVIGGEWVEPRLPPDERPTALSPPRQM